MRDMNVFNGLFRFGIESNAQIWIVALRSELLGIKNSLKIHFVDKNEGVWACAFNGSRSKDLTKVVCNSFFL